MPTSVDYPGGRLNGNARVNRRDRSAINGHIKQAGQARGRIQDMSTFDEKLEAHRRVMPIAVGYSHYGLGRLWSHYTML